MSTVININTKIWYDKRLAIIEWLENSWNEINSITLKTTYLYHKTPYFVFAIAYTGMFKSNKFIGTKRLCLRLFK